MDVSGIGNSINSGIAASSANQQQVGQAGGHRHHHRGGGGGGLGQLSQQLGLTQDQRDQLRPLFADEQKQVQSVLQDSSLSSSQKQSQIQQIRQSTQQQFNGILTPEQQQQLAQIESQQQQSQAGGAQLA